MSEAEAREHAARIIAEHNEDYEFCLVYEDPELEDATEKEWRAVHDAMRSARVSVQWLTLIPAPAPADAACYCDGGSVHPQCPTHASAWFDRMRTPTRDATEEDRK